MLNLFHEANDFWVWVKEIETEDFYEYRSNQKIYLNTIHQDRIDLMKRCKLSCQTEFRFYTKPENANDLEKVWSLVKPIVKNSKVIGFLEIHKIYDVILTEEKLFYLECVAHLFRERISVVLKETELSYQHLENRILISTGVKMIGCDDLEKLSEIIHLCIHDAIGSTTVRLLLMNKDKTKFIYFDKSKLKAFSSEFGLAGQCIRTGMIRVWKDPPNNVDFNGCVDISTTLSLISIPLIPINKDTMQIEPVGVIQAAISLSEINEAKNKLLHKIMKVLGKIIMKVSRKMEEYQQS